MKNKTPFKQPEPENIIELEMRNTNISEASLKILEVLRAARMIGEETRIDVQLTITEFRHKH